MRSCRYCKRRVRRLAYKCAVCNRVILTWWQLGIVGSLVLIAVTGLYIILWG